MKTQSSSTPLSDALTAIREKYAAMIPPPQASIIESHMASVRKNGTDGRILKVGEKAPPFTLKTGDGQIVSSAKLLAKGPLVVSFFRGGWCPYCATEAEALNASYDEFKSNGAELVLVSPQSAKHNRAQVEKSKLHVPVLVDDKNETGKKFGVVYTFPNDLKDLYLNFFKTDISSINGDGVWELPIPARFIIDQAGTIRDVKADPDYRFRPEPQETISLIKALANRKS